MKDENGNLHTDNFTWLVVYNSDLEYFFQPVMFTEGLYNNVFNFMVGESEKLILTFNLNESIGGDAYAYLINPEGKKRDSLVVPDQSEEDRFHVFRKDRNEFWLADGNRIITVNDKLR